MPNAIKYNVSDETLALKKGNFWIGTGDVGKGPTSSTGFYNGITPPTGGYTIYLNKASDGPSIYTVSTVAQLTGLTSQIAAQTFTTSGACFNYFATQTDKMIFNIDYPAIITSGLSLNLDAGFTPSYPTTATTWYNVCFSGSNGTLSNGPTFNSDNNGSIVFDGTNDFVNISSQTALFSNASFTVSIWMYPLSNASDGMLFATYGPGPDFNSRAVFIRLKSDRAISFGFYNDDVTSGTAAFVYNAWQNIVLTYNYTTDISTMYLNGNILAAGAVGPCIETRTMSVRIANWFSQEYYRGRVSSFFLYNRSLSQGEIQQNYNAQRGRFGL